MSVFKNLQPLQESLGIVFKDESLLLRAFTHRSFLNEHVGLGVHHNERLEYLGDAVLELVVTHFLFHEYPDTPEGQLTAYRSSLVRTESIGEAAKNLGFSEYLHLSKGEAKDTGKAREYILANTFEAFVGALYLDQGYEAAKQFISEQLFYKLEDIIKEGTWRDAKSWVQELAQEYVGKTPTYQVLAAEGPDHDKTFTIGIYFGEEQVATGVGRSKQDAQQAAARKAIEVKGWNN